MQNISVFTVSKITAIKGLLLLFHLGWQPANGGVTAFTFFDTTLVFSQITAIKMLAPPFSTWLATSNWQSYVFFLFF